MKEFTYKSAEELENMSTEEQNQYVKDMKAYEKTQREIEIKEATKGLVEGQVKLENQVKEVAESVTSLEEAIKTIGGVNWEDVSKRIEDYLTENIEEVKSAYRNKGIIDITKAVGTVTTANGTLPTALPANFVAERQGVPNIALRRPSLLDYVTTYSTNQKSLPYIEAVPGEGDFAVVAEGAEKPQLDIDWVTRYVTPMKFAGWIKVTEEAIEDIPRLRDLIVNYLRDKHDLFKEKQVFNYIDTNATPYVTGGALAGAVVNPNIMDVVNALQLQIVNTPNYTDEPDFMGDVVLLNIVDFYKMFGAAKDAFGRPLFESGYQGGRTFQYNGFTFVASTLITAGNVILMDSRKVEVTTYSPYRVEIGWVNDDFIKNQFVILGESRGHILIKNHDKRAFVKASISAVIADIKAP